ncbi:hypothetical protein [Bradyrhizobium brasilense]|uniref:hypothetical protein n=1 Tax=Bradyrhizobium brasilense TaxID=1419277 RepID=UPI001456CCE4|nr:hypothetical protein [Bradyrhizobium brasilense]
MPPRLSPPGAGLVHRRPGSDLDLVMMTTAARYGQPKEGLAAMDILANIIIPAVRDAH